MPANRTTGDCPSGRTIRRQELGRRQPVAAVDDAAVELIAAHRSAERLVARMLDGGWSGAAADAFGDAWAEWEAGASEVTSALEAMRDGLVLAGRELSSTDHATSDTLGRLGVRLTP